MIPQNVQRTNSYDFEEKRSIAIIIDCWDFNKFREDTNILYNEDTRKVLRHNHPPDNYVAKCEEVFQNICNRLDKLKLLQAISLSTYNLKTYQSNGEMISDDESYHNAVELVGDKLKYDVARRRKGRIDRWNLELHSTLRNHKWNCKAYELYLHPQIMMLIEKYKPIEDIYILGLTWGECLHKREVGIRGMRGTGKRILTYKDCTLMPHRINEKVVKTNYYFVDMDNETSLQKIDSNLYETVGI